MTSLTLNNNPIGDSSKYCQFAVESCPKLKFLDGKSPSDLRKDTTDAPAEIDPVIDEDMSSPGLVKVIAKEWERELK